MAVEDRRDQHRSSCFIYAGELRKRFYQLAECGFRFLSCRSVRNYQPLIIDASEQTGGLVVPRGGEDRIIRPHDWSLDDTAQRGQFPLLACKVGLWDTSRTVCRLWLFSILINPNPTDKPLERFLKINDRNRR